jgi:hypothetical protein
MITEIYNVLSMISPLCFWWKHKNKHNKTLIHTFLISHIPISIFYHFSLAFNFVNSNVRHVLKLCDCIMIHIYTIICNYKIAKIQNIQISFASKIIRCFGYTTNIHSIHRLFITPTHDTLFSLYRLFAIGFLSNHTIITSQCNNFKKQMTLYGCLSSLFYVIDPFIANYGHSIFHLMLGFLHNEMFLFIDKLQPI